MFPVTDLRTDVSTGLCILHVFTAAVFGTSLLHCGAACALLLCLEQCPGCAFGSASLLSALLHALAAMLLQKATVQRIPAAANAQCPAYLWQATRHSST